MTRVLILGGYGTFGGRLARLLAPDARLTLLIAGRSLERARKFCAALGGAATLEALRFERGRYALAQLRESTPEIVVDASGPFQHYGDDPYALVKACVALKIHYLDLADSSRFVEGVAAFDDEARAQDIFVLSGVSSFPVLTAAVVRAMSHDMTRLDDVAAGIAPSPFADIGPNVFRAIAGYAGKKVSIRRDGAPKTAYALINSRYFTVAPPGRLPLLRRRFALVDVPDLQAIPALWPALKSIWTGAGPVPASMHGALRALAWLVRLRLLPSLLPLAGFMQRATRVLRWGEHRGGMFVTLSGAGADGRSIEREWHMLAEGDDGPLIPSMAAAAVIGNLLAGRRPKAGARNATTDLELADYDRMFGERRIVTGVRERSDPSLPLYRRILGTAYDTLPKAVQRLHAFDGERVAQGRAAIDRGNGWIARRIARAFGFPQVSGEVPVTVELRREGDREVWQRNFGDQVFSSIQEEGRGRLDGLLCERFGPCAFGIALVVDGDHLRLIIRRWTLYGFPIPLWLAPICVAYEGEFNGRFRFFVELRHRLIGLIVRYQGLLEVRAQTREPAL